MTLVGVVSRERSVNTLAPFAILDGTALLGGPIIRPSPLHALSLPGYVLTSPFEGCSDLGLIGSGCFVGFLNEQFFDIFEVQ
jgi:hypothetical protein